MPDIADAVIYYVVFLFSTTLHEAAHAWAAARGGDLTAYHGGQSLPFPHSAYQARACRHGRVPLISVLTTGWPFGYASAPFDRDWASRYPKRAGWMALAGPAANLLLVIIAAILVRIGVAAHVFFPPETVRFGEIAGTVDGGMWPAAARMIGVLFSQPSPLRVQPAAVAATRWERRGAALSGPGATRRYQNFIWHTPALALVGFLIAWQLFGTIFNPIFFAALGLLYPGVSYH